MSPIFINVRVCYDVDSIPRAQQLDLGSLLQRHHVDAVALVRPDVEALPEDAPHPSVRDGALVLVTVALDEASRDLRDRHDQSLRAALPL